MRHGVVLVAAGLLATCARAETTPQSGLQGLVLRGPVTPVCRIGTPCDEPARVTLVFSRAGTEAGRVRTTAQGRFRITLRPGRYGVRTTVRVGMRPIEPRLVTVPTGRFARITFHIDTGIR